MPQPEQPTVRLVLVTGDPADDPCQWGFPSEGTPLCGKAKGHYFHDWFTDKHGDPWPKEHDYVAPRTLTEEDVAVALHAVHEAHWHGEMEAAALLAALTEAPQ